jgi:SNF2 family DNA or RNA helicase
LADAPRVGKTGAAIIAADYCWADRILVVTTASGRAVWKRGFADWSAFPRQVQVLTPSDILDPRTNTVIVGWGSVSEPTLRNRLLQQSWDILILDESHYAKNPDAKRTQAVYGPVSALAKKADVVWCLTGTPMPNAPNDLWPMLNALAPERLEGMDYDDFMHRYCVVRMKKISNFRSIPVVIGGKNLPELRQRLDGFWLRRTQEDVGIRPPIYETYPLLVSETVRAEVERGVDTRTVLAAAKDGSTKDLELHLGKLRRVTGRIKALAVVEALKDEFECGLDKIALMHWHTDTGRILREGLSRFGVVGIDGSTSAKDRQTAQDRFRDDPKTRVFVGQIQAAGEAIDLSATAMLWFVETSFVPKDMQQAALRITNVNQSRQAIVRVCVLDGSIDEAVERILLRKWSAIREVIR